MVKVRAVFKAPHRKPVPMLITPNHVGVCSLVSGLYEHIDLSGDLVAVVNINDMDRRFQKNVRIMGKQLYGPVVIVRMNKGLYESLSDEETENILRMIKTT